MGEVGGRQLVVGVPVGPLSGSVAAHRGEPLRAIHARERRG